MKLPFSLGLYIATFVLALIALIFRPFKNYRKSPERNIITFLLINLLITAFASFVRDIILELDVPPLVTRIANEVESMTYFVLHTLLSPAFSLYVMLLNGAAKDKGKKFYWIFWTPILLLEVFVCLNPLFHTIFIYDENGVYHRQMGIIVLYVIALLYFVNAIVSLFKTWTLLDNEYMKGFRWFILFISVGIVIQALYSDLQIEALVETIAIYGIMLTVDCNDGLINNETKLPNQSSYKVNVRLYGKYGYKYTVINIKFFNLVYYNSLMDEKSKKKMINYISDLIESCSPKSELYRYSEDTFVLLVNKNRNIEVIESKLRKTFENSITDSEFSIDPHMIISIAKVPEDIDNPKSHYKLAEFEPKVLTEKLTFLKGKDFDFLRRYEMIEKALYRAIKDRSFEVYYQPIYDSTSKKIISCEALCRLNDSELGYIPPSEFIPVAEFDGNIAKIGDIVFERVCQDIWSYGFDKLGIKYVEVNLSFYQMLEKGIVERYLDFLKQYNVPINMINLEITETSSASNIKSFSILINRLMDLGFSFSLDDYGTAYSNISNVMSTNYLNIKMDSSILWDASNNEKSKTLLVSNIKTFRSLGCNVIQEGVETKEQLELVINAGANLIQGFYFSKPLVRDDFVEFVRRFNDLDERNIVSKDDFIW